MTKRLATAVALILAANALYAPYINRMMMCDEANTLYQYADNIVRALFSYATPNNHMLHSVLVWGVTNLSGTSPVAVRFVAFMSALLAVALMFRVASRFAGYRAGVAATAFLITTLTFADYSVNARGYTLSVALTLLLIDRLFLTRNIYTRRYRYSLLAISFALILLLPSMIMLLVAAGIWLLWKSRTNRHYRSLIPPMIVGVALASAFYAPSFIHGDLFSQDISQFGESDLLTLLSLWLDQTFGTPAIGLLFALSCGIGLAVLVKRYRPARDLILVLLGTTALIAIGQVIVLHKLFFARNYLYLIAPVALLGGIGLSRVAGRYTLPFIAGVLILSLIPLRALDRDYIEKDVYARVEQNVGVNDQILAGPCFNAPVQYELLHSGQEDKLFPTPPKQRVFVLYREGTYEDVLKLYNMQDKVADCKKVTDGSWDPFNVYLCKPVIQLPQ